MTRCRGSVVRFKVLEETEGMCLSEDGLCKVRCSVLTYALGSVPKYLPLSHFKSHYFIKR